MRARSRHPDGGATQQELPDRLTTRVIVEALKVVAVSLDRLSDRVGRTMLSNERLVVAVTRLERVVTKICEKLDIQEESL